MLELVYFNYLLASPVFTLEHTHTTALSQLLRSQQNITQLNYQITTYSVQ